jgi:hypothetical protein
MGDNTRWWSNEGGGVRRVRGSREWPLSFGRQFERQTHGCTSHFEWFDNAAQQRVGETHQSYSIWWWTFWTLATRMAMRILKGGDDSLSNWSAGSRRWQVTQGEMDIWMSSQPMKSTWSNGDKSQQVGSRVSTTWLKGGVRKVGNSTHSLHSMSVWCHLMSVADLWRMIRTNWETFHFHHYLHENHVKSITCVRHLA